MLRISKHRRHDWSYSSGKEKYHCLYDSRLVSKQTMHHLPTQMNHLLTKCLWDMLKCGWRSRLFYWKVTKSLKERPFYPASCGIQCSAVLLISSSTFILAVSVKLTNLKIEHCQHHTFLYYAFWCSSIFKARLEGYLQYVSCWAGEVSSKKERADNE